MGIQRQKVDIKEIKWGYVDNNDIPQTLNPGYSTFKNFKIDVNKRIKKQNGFKVIKNYEEYNKFNVSNIPIDYNRLKLNTRDIPAAHIFDIKLNTKTYEWNNNLHNAGDKETFKDILYNICGVINADRTDLAHRRLNLDDSILNSDYVITPSVARWDRMAKGNVKFIHTPEHTYIISDYQNENGSAPVWKYDYRLQNDLGYKALMRVCLAKQIDVVLEQVAVSGTGGNISTGTKYYIILPVYNTGAIPDPNGISGKIVLSAKRNIKIKINGLYDPYIKFLRIYRTKGNTTDLKTAKFYFVEQIDVKKVIGYDMQNSYDKLIDLYIDSTPDELLGDELDITKAYTNSFYINFSSVDNNGSATPPNPTFFYISDTEAKRFVAGKWKNRVNLFNVYFSDSYYIDYNKTNNPPVTLTSWDAGDGMKASCGCYAYNRLFLGGDIEYPELIYVSEPVTHDAFSTLVYRTVGTSKTNYHSAIEQVGQNIFIFAKKGGLWVLRPTQSVDTPFILEKITDSIGCDSLVSICVFNRLAYFIYNKKLYEMNEFGQYQEISGGINSILAQAVTDPILKVNTKDKYIKIMFRITDNPDVNSKTAINIDFYPDQRVFIEQTGYKDIYTLNDTTFYPTLYAKRERYQLLNYCELDNKEEWGVNADGDIVKRDYTYVNTGNNTTAWPGYHLPTQPGSLTYPVEAIMTKSLYFDAKVMINAIRIYGNGKLKYNFDVDNKLVMSNNYKAIDILKLGTTIPVNLYGEIFTFTLKWDEASDINFDFIEIIVNQTQKITIKNDVRGGTTANE